MTVRSFVACLALAGLTAGASARTVAVVDPTTTAEVTSHQPDTTQPKTEQDWNRAQTRGVKWLKTVQHNDGGWGSGEWGTEGMQAPSDVATTAFVVLALYRDAGLAGHGEAINKGVDFVLSKVDSAPKAGPRLDTPEGTQIQYKLGQLVDTHLAALMLGELSGDLDSARNIRVSVALDTVIGKVQAAQQANGAFDSNGWAPVLSSSMATQALYSAMEAGKDVDMAVIERAEDYQTGNVTADGTIDASDGAGVSLYSVASTLRNSKSSKGRKEAAGDDFSRDAQAEVTASQAITGDSGGAVFAGFGSIGGEEMLSYMMISDSLVDEDGEEWNQWEEKVGTYLVNIQNADGSWVGHHCITSRTFTTAGAIMTLAADYQS